MSKPEGKRVLALASVRHTKSSPLISAQEKTQSDVPSWQNPGQASSVRLHVPGVQVAKDGSRTFQQSGYVVTIARTETRLQVSQLTLNDTRVLATRLCNAAKAQKHSCRETRHESVSFQTGSSSRACSTTSPAGKVGICNLNVQLKREKCLLTQQDADLVIAVSVVQDRNRPGQIMKDDRRILVRHRAFDCMSQVSRWQKTGRELFNNPVTL